MTIVNASAATESIVLLPQSDQFDFAVRDTLVNDRNSYSWLSTGGDDIQAGGFQIDFEEIPPTGFATRIDIDLSNDGAPDVVITDITARIGGGALAGGRLSVLTSGAAAFLEELLSFDDTLTGSARFDLLQGFAGADTLVMGAGDDSAFGGAGDDRLDGGSGNDELVGEGGNDAIRGRSGDDLTSGGGGDDALQGNGGNDEMLGGGGADAISGGEGEDTIEGDGGADTLSGGQGDDRLEGGAGADLMRGGAGRDRLFGGAGDDIYNYIAVTDSPADAADRILGFDLPGSRRADLIDLDGVDAVEGQAGDQDFTFRGAFGGPAEAEPGSLYLREEAGETVVYGNTDADAAPELRIRIADGASRAIHYIAADFDL
jgi:Ca2+-binding RTX toxin-like protein